MLQQYVTLELKNGGRFDYWTLNREFVGEFIARNKIL